MDSSLDSEAIPKEILVNGIAFAHQDIAQVVQDFYRQVEHDPILKVPFQSVHDWSDHIRRLTHFWWLRLGGKPYMFSQYNPVAKHFYAGFNDEFLARWLLLFRQTLKTHLSAEQVEMWTAISEQMGHVLSVKNQMFGEHVKKMQLD